MPFVIAVLALAGLAAPVLARRLAPSWPAGRLVAAGLALFTLGGLIAARLILAGMTPPGPASLREALLAFSEGGMGLLRFWLPGFALMACLLALRDRRRAAG